MILLVILLVIFLDDADTEAGEEGEGREGKVDAGTTVVDGDKDDKEDDCEGHSGTLASGRRKYEAGGGRGGNRKETTWNRTGQERKKLAPKSDC